MSRPAVAIVGPTGSGKSDVAMAYATARNDADIVVVDALQVYRGLNIGTGKPTDDDRRRVTHHCLDVADPRDEFTVTQWLEHFRQAEAAIVESGRRAVLVAGTGLYLRSAIDRFDIPGQYPDVRSRLVAEVADIGLAALVDRLRVLDPLAVSRIEASNERRVLRALEVCEGSGRPFSSYGPGLDAYPPNLVVQVGLRWARERLGQRIARRVDAMLEAGWLDEVRQLHVTGSLGRTARVALGYRELADHLDGRCTLDDARDAIVTRTRQYAVRQERWFRRDPRIVWVDVEHDPIGEVLPALERLT